LLNIKKRINLFGRSNSTAMKQEQRLGFTLIEILVVVAIIALLISILLPSLKKARDRAMTVVCASQIGQLTRAEAGYESAYKGWIPGSNVTTGIWFRQKKLAGITLTTWEPGLDGQPTLTGNFDYFTPLRIEMYGAKAIGYDRNNPNPHPLYLAGTDGVFNCPSNPHIAVCNYDYGHGAPSVLLDPIRAYSYIPMKNFMAVPYDDKGDYVIGRQDGEIAVKSPQGYTPRNSKLGRSSVKVFLADGLHQYKPKTTTPERISYFSAMQSSRGTMGAPPSDAVGPPIRGRYWRDAWGSARRFSYRHGDNNSINAGFFDGHVSLLMAEFGGQRDGMKCKGFTGPAVKPHLYYPSGSKVTNPSQLHMDHIPPGTILQ